MRRRLYSISGQHPIVGSQSLKTKTINFILTTETFMKTCNEKKKFNRTTTHVYGTRIKVRAGRNKGCKEPHQLTLSLCTPWTHTRDRDWRGLRGLEPKKETDNQLSVRQYRTTPRRGREFLGRTATKSKDSHFNHMKILLTSVTTQLFLSSFSLFTLLSRERLKRVH